MKNYDESELFDIQINNLEEELQELLDKAEKILGYKADDVINISLDKRAGIFLGVYYTNTYVLRGIAVKYK